VVSITNVTGINNVLNVYKKKIRLMGSDIDIYFHLFPSSDLKIKAVKASQTFTLNMVQSYLVKK